MKNVINTIIKDFFFLVLDYFKGFIALYIVCMRVYF